MIMGVATIYAETHSRTLLNKNMIILKIIILFQVEGFLMIRIQNVCGKAIQMCLTPILVGAMMALSALRPPVRV